MDKVYQFQSAVVSDQQLLAIWRQTEFATNHPLIATRDFHHMPDVAAKNVGVINPAGPRRRASWLACKNRMVLVLRFHMIVDAKAGEIEARRLRHTSRVELNLEVPLTRYLRPGLQLFERHGCV